MLDSVVNVLKSVSGANPELVKKEAGDSYVYVAPESILESCKALYSNSETDFHVLQVITGCDFPKKEATDECPAQEERIEVSYILTSYRKKHDLILKVKLDRNNPEVDSVCEIWKSADFQERECFDMVGVKFRNHPDLRRILCPEDWEGFPLRKDYQVQKEWHGMEVNPENKMNNEDRAFAENLKQ